DEAAGHRVDDVLVQGLEVEQRAALIGQLHVGLAQLVAEHARQVGDGDVREQVDEDDGLQRARAGCGGAVGRNDAEVGELEHRAEGDESQQGGEVCPDAREQDAGDDDDERVEEIERGVDAAGDVEHGGGEDQVSQNLGAGLENVVSPAAEQQVHEAGDDVPGEDDADEQRFRNVGRGEPDDGQLDDEQAGNDDDPDLDQPGQPCADIEVGRHRLLSSVGRRERALHASGAQRCALRSRTSAGQLGDEREQRHVQRDHDAADHEAEEADHDRLQESEHVLGGRVDVVFVEVGDLLEHGVHRARGFADADHLRDHVGEDAAFLQRIDNGAAFFNGLAHLHERALEHGVAGCARGDGETFQDGHAGGDQSAERAAEARDRDLAQQHADNRKVEQELVEVVAAFGMLGDLLDGNDQRDQAGDEHPREAAHEVAGAHDDAGGQRKVNTQAGEQLRKRGDDELQQAADDQHGDADDRHGIDERRLDGRFQLDGFFDVGRKALENRVQNTAGLARLDHVGGEVVEDLGIATHGVGEGGAALDRGPHAVQGALERLALLVGAKDFKTLHQRQSGVDHDGELAEEDGNVLGADLASTEGGQGELLALLLDGVGGNAFAQQLCLEHLLVFSHAFAVDLLTRGVLASVSKSWHAKPPISSGLWPGVEPEQRVNHRASVAFAPSAHPAINVPFRHDPSRALTQPLPFHGRRRAGGLHTRAAVDHFLQLVRHGRAQQGRLQRNLLLEIERGERLVERLHPVLVLAGLHGRVNLVDFVFADQVADGRVRHQDFHGAGASLAADFRQQRLTHDAFQHERKLGANLRLLVRGEDVNNTVDGGRGRVGVQRAEGQVAGFGDAQRRLNRFQIAHFADEHHVRVFAERGAEGLGESLGIGVHLALVHQAILVLVDELDRVFDGDDVVVAL